MTKLYTVQDFAAMNAKSNQWPQTPNRIRNLLYQLNKYGIEGGFVRVGRRVLITPDKFYEAIAKLPEQGLKYKKKDMPEGKSLLSDKKFIFIEERDRTLEALEEAGNIFYKSINRSASIGDLRVPVIDYLWRCVFLIGGLANRANQVKEKK